MACFAENSKYSSANTKIGIASEQATQSKHTGGNPSSLVYLQVLKLLILTFVS